jgi:peptide deformylase
MAVLPIVKEGQPVLHVRAKEVDPKEIGSVRMQKLVADMLETMYAANGIGIAAPQVGESIRLFIAESAQGPIALFNPTFTAKSKKMVKGEEGCLSVPGKFDKVFRHKTVSIEALTHTGARISFEARDFFARILQHEMDHLDGTLFVDRVKEQMLIPV